MSEKFSHKMTSLHGRNLNLFTTSIVEIFKSYINYAAPGFKSKPVPACLCRLVHYNRLATVSPIHSDWKYWFTLEEWFLDASQPQIRVARWLVTSQGSWYVKIPQFVGFEKVQNIMPTSHEICLKSMICNYKLIILLRQYLL